MSRQLLSPAIVVASLAAVLATTLSSSSHAAGPVAPGAAVETLEVASGLKASLFAAEPLLSSPSNIDIDAAGRVWVCEVVNYRGKKDTREEGDRILVLEDTDGDGAADKQTVFHQGRDVDSALGICVIGDGPGRRAIISCAPEVFVLHDDDGDLVADRKEVLFTKTGRPQHDHSVHAFSVGPDGRLYFNFGNTGGAVHDRDGNLLHDRFGQPVNDSGKPFRQGMVFRCKPDGSDFEVLGHNFRNNYEVAVDSFGSLWQSDNDDDGNRGVRINWVLEYGNYGYVDELTGAGWRIPRTNLEAEVPLQHWHQNDPGVVPNLLLTGAGSPTGICVYEGSLLPERYRGQLIHCDAGPNIVRAYLTQPAGAGFTADAEPVIDGSADRWFRPSDVCVAPDGSLLVADWYDPGVGGHGMADTEKGRIYRLAPAGSRWSVPPVNLKTVAGAVAALASPNLSTRATALERLQADPEAAQPLLAAAYTAAEEPRLKARLAWAWGMLPGQAEAVIDLLADNEDDRLRVVAIRMCRLVQGDTLDLVERLCDDKSAAVRRAAAVALHKLDDPQADQLWARLAVQHTASDRFETEALGIGADGVWNSRLAAWQAAAGAGWRSPAGREIVWRSRAEATAGLLCDLLADPAISTGESLGLLRSLDFQPAAAMEAAVAKLLPNYTGSAERLPVVLPELVLRVGEADRTDESIRRRAAEAASMVPGTAAFVEIVSRFALADRTGDLITLAAAATTEPALAVQACQTAVGLAGVQPINDWLAAHAASRTSKEIPTQSAAAGDAARLLEAVGQSGRKDVQQLLTTIALDSAAEADHCTAAVRGLAGSRDGGSQLLELATTGRLPESLRPAAAVALSTSRWADIRQAAAEALPLPAASGGQPLPPLAELLKRRGNARAGQQVFAGAGTCAKCHVVGGEGKAVGPDLSGIGAKLSKQALYESILAPSAAISHNYETYTLLTDDGRLITGLLVSKTDEAVVLKTAEGVDVTTPTASIDELTRQPISLMPANIASTLQPQQFVDLVTWLETLRTIR